jgi:hypothetical protein
VEIFAGRNGSGLQPGAVVEVPDAAAFAQTRLGLVLDPVQVDLLRSLGNRGILNCTRQWGKSTMAAVAAVYRAHMVPNSLVLVASPTKRQSAELVRKAAGFLRHLGIRQTGDGDNETSLQFPNGSRIVGLPGTESTIRGFSSVSLLLIDEASRVSDAMYKALRPMLAVGGGDLWMMSTPFGRRGFFYETWMHGGEHWKRVRVPATECPRIPASFLEFERSDMGTTFEQEYMCEFVDCSSGAFDRDLGEAALDEEEEAWQFEPLWKER